MQQKPDNTPIKRMAELLRQGATLTDLSCPACSSPLFRLKDGTLWCAKDEKKVIILKEGEEPPKEAAAPKTSPANAAYDKLEATLTAKIQGIERKIEKTEDPDELQKLTGALNELLSSLEKIKTMKAWKINLTAGTYDNFPQNIHSIEIYSTAAPGKQVQLKLLQALTAINKKEFSFEEIANPTVPNGRVIFEFGLADSKDFTFLDEEECARMKDFLGKERLHSIDFFCAIRYYKVNGEKKKALKFDYYMLRTVFGKDTFEVQVFHERGPRYISPQDLTAFVFNRVNDLSSKKILKKGSN